jgi:protein-L-isoaspartate(D-aspartate) O-methyltransferase
MEYEMTLTDIAKARFNMIEQQIRPWDVLDTSILELLSVVKREDFVPVAYRSLAFADLEIPLLGGQCMLAPRVEARLLQDLGIAPTDRVLEIGTGSGYMAALLAHRAQRVISLEILPELVAMARDNLARAGITNAEVRCFDGSKGAPAESPFDVILLSGSVAEVPQSLLAHLKVGGRLGAIVGDEPVMRGTIVTRNSPIDFTTKARWDTVAPRLQNFAEPSQFKF